MDSFQGDLTEVRSVPVPSSETWQDRHLLTQVGQQLLAFPSSLVAEVMVVQKSQVLSLPFYDSTVLGVVHYRGNIIPLITAHSLCTPQGETSTQVRRMLEAVTIVRLNHLVSTLSGVGIVVDKMLNSISYDQISTHSMTEQGDTTVNSAIAVFQPEKIPQSIWRPLENNY